MNPQDWTQLGVGGAAVFAVCYVVFTFLKFLGNHLSQINASLEANAKAMVEMAAQFEMMRDAHAIQARAFDNLAQHARADREHEWRPGDNRRSASLDMFGLETKRQREARERRAEGEERSER